MSKGRKHGIPVALDDSVAAERTLQYVAHMTAGRSDFKVRLLHLLRPVPPSLHR